MRTILKGQVSNFFVGEEIPLTEAQAGWPSPPPKRRHASLTLKGQITEWETIQIPFNCEVILGVATPEPMRIIERHEVVEWLHNPGFHYTEFDLQQHIQKLRLAAESLVTIGSVQASASVSEAADVLVNLRNRLYPRGDEPRESDTRKLVNHVRDIGQDTVAKVADTRSLAPTPLDDPMRGQYDPTAKVQGSMVGSSMMGHNQRNTGLGSQSHQKTPQETR